MDITQTSNRLINRFPPLNNITPFTRVDGWSFLEVLEGLRNYVVNTLVEEIDANNKEISDRLDKWLEQYTSDLQEVKDNWQNLFNAFIANIIEELEGLNDQSMANLIRNRVSETRKALEEILGEKYGITPQSFGALGDNATDDTLSLQAWINHIANNKLDGYMPPGRYFHTKSLIFPAGSSGWSIKGAGRGQVVIRYNPNDSSTGISGTNITDVSLAGFTIDGGFRTHNRLYQGISIKNPMRLTIDDIHIENYGNSCALIFADDVDVNVYGYVTITNSSCDGGGNANNGWNLVNMRDSLMSNVYAFNGGQNSNNTPSCGAQFKNACRNSHMVNVYTYGWKNGLTMGGDNYDVIPMDCSITGADYGSNYGIIIGKGNRNVVNATASGSRTRAVQFGLNGEGNHVTVNIVNPATSSPPVNMNNSYNTVIVSSAYGVTGAIFEVGVGVRNVRMVVMDESARTINTASLVIDNSGRTDNKIVSMTSLAELNNANGLSTFLYFNGAVRTWLSYTPSSDSFNLRGAVDSLILASTTEVSHGVDNRASAGTAIRRYTQLYASSGSINTSDEREKRDVDLDMGPELRAWARVDFVKYRWNDAVEQKGSGARIHFGVIAQRVKEAFESEGLDPFAYGVLCYDEWESEDEIVNEAGEIVHHALEAGNRYAVRYEEAMILESALTRWKFEQLSK